MYCEKANNFEAIKLHTKQYQMKSDFLIIVICCLCNTYSTVHTRGRWKFSLADIKKIFCRSDLWSKISHVLVMAA